ncbi:sulfotransferase family 2 domain-containing protein [Loktanella sp. DJP18]|uniref:sulfotransferase family 2 domain-containing protein n=1 Tax=Loktanella sp. DJP18 TaxID=3409788 RepID=UPI003BB64D51
MTLLKANGKLFYFAHIPKTGGSSVETAMRKAGAKRALHFHKRLDYVRCNLQHMHAELFDTFIPPKFYDKGFCVVRHPIARLVSEYRWRQTLNQADLPFDGWVRRQIAAYAKDPYVLDNHIRPQHEFIGKKIKVFRFEEGMDVILGKMSRVTGLTLNPKTHVRKPETRTHMTWSPETRALALRFYEMDFVRLDYKYDTDIPYLSLAR